MKHKKNETIIVYEGVNKRNNPREMNFEDFLENPEEIYSILQKDDFKEKLKEIKEIQNKELRNEAKRNYLPAVELSQTGVLSIDIDGISNLSHIKSQCIERLSKLETCMSVQESVSGNLVAFFKYDCTVAEYKFLYFKLYLELVLLISVNIDFLPEIGRLRYVSVGKVYHLDYDSKILTEILDVEEVPHINTSVKKDEARRVVYGSN